MAIKTRLSQGLKEGDILHIKLGLIDDDFRWIPTADEIDHAREMWESQVPEGVKVVVTPIGVETEIIPSGNDLAITDHSMSPMSIVDLEITEPDRPQWPAELFEEEG